MGIDLLGDQEDRIDDCGGVNFSSCCRQSRTGYLVVIVADHRAADHVIDIYAESEHRRFTGIQIDGPVPGYRIARNGPVRPDLSYLCIRRNLVFGCDRKIGSRLAFVLYG